jgi:3-methylcrotonyl-CoA carboxylase alpha subunit
VQRGRMARALGADRHDVTLDDRRWTLAVYAEGERITVFAPDGTLVLQEVDALAHAGEGAAPGGRLAAPMPGKVVAFLAKAGDAVTSGQPLAVMEAMKMEHTIASPRDGKIAELLYGVGDQVAEGAELLRLE